MARQIPIPLSLELKRSTNRFPDLGELLIILTSSGGSIDGMQCTAPLSPIGYFGGTRQAYDSNRTVEGYDRRKR